MDQLRVAEWRATRPSKQQASYTEKGDEYGAETKGKWEHGVASDLGPGGAGGIYRSMGREVARRPLRRR